MKTCIFPIFAVVLAVLIVGNGIPSINAQDRAITYGETVEDELTAESNHQWTFEGAAGDRLIISMHSETFDSALGLLGPEGELIATDNDGGEGDDSLLEVSLARDGTHTIVAANNSTDTSGIYTLSLLVADQSDVESGDEPEIILETQGELIAGETTTHSFVGTEDDTITIFASSNDFDPVIQLFDESGDLLASDDDNGGNLNALIAIKLHADDTFTIEVASYLGDGSGPYSLIVTKNIPPIELNSTVEGEIQTDSVVYALPIENDANVTISASSIDFDPVLILIDENDEVIGEDDDSGGNLNAELSVSLESETSYFIIVRSFEEDGAGSFELSITAADSTDEDTDSVEAGTIEYGETVTANADGQSMIYLFDGKAGDDIIISVQSQDFDTVLELFDPNDNRIAQNDDVDGENLNSSIRITLPEDGQFRIVVSSFSPPALGEFTLTLTN